MAVDSARAEWQRYYPLPLAAAVGYATSVIHIYGLGPYIEPISESFGWSRTQATVGLTISTIIQAVFGILIGYVVDRKGPRVFALIGIVLTCAAFALLGTATGNKANWYLLWVVMAIATLPVQATIWTSAVATRFEASRGMAFAVTLCGASVATALFPWLGTRLIAEYGWHQAIMVQAGIWVLIAFPPIWLFFRGARDGGKSAEATPASGALEGVDLAEGLRSWAYWRLMFASLLFTFTIIALVVHFVPILTGKGLGKLEAAGIAALIGLASIAGRLGTGFMLDRFRAARVGAVVFLLPAIACLLLILGGGSGAAAMVAALFIGLTLGAEIDVIVYLATRLFGLKNFGSLYGGLLCALSIGTATGPLAASQVFDRYGDYAMFLWATIGLMAASSLLLISLPQPRFGAKSVN
jgi:predicted MFS family arabinose efflux permease